MGKVKALYVTRNADGKIIGVKDVWEDAKNKLPTMKEVRASRIAQCGTTLGLDACRIGTQVLSREVDLADRFRKQLAKAKGKLQ